MHWEFFLFPCPTLLISFPSGGWLLLQKFSVFALRLLTPKVNKNRKERTTEENRDSCWRTVSDKPVYSGGALILVLGSKTLNRIITIRLGIYLIRSRFRARSSGILQYLYEQQGLMAPNFALWQGFSIDLERRRFPGLFVRERGQLWLVGRLFRGQQFLTKAVFQRRESKRNISQWTAGMNWRFTCPRFRRTRGKSVPSFKLAVSSSDFCKSASRPLSNSICEI